MSPIIRNFIAKGLFKKKGVIANKKTVDFSANALEQRLKNAGVDPNAITSENELNQILSYVKQAEDAAFDQRFRVIAGDTPEGRKITEKLFGKKGEVVDMTGKKMDTSQGIMGGKSVKELMESGQVQKGTEGIKKSKKITDRDLFKDANQRLRGPIKGKMDMGEFGKVDVETDYSAAINRKEFFDPKAKNMYDKTVKTGPEFFKAQKEQILNTINRKKRDMVPPTHSNYKLLKKSLQDQEDALEAIKVTEDLGGNENMFDFLRTQNIADYKSKPLKRSNYVRNETEQEIADRLNKQNQDSLQNLKNKLDDPEDMADGGVAGLLGERQNFAMGKRAFLKLLGGFGAGIAGLKSGLLGFGKGGAKKAVTETVKQTAGSGTPPPYFFKLVEKIQKLGDDVTPNYATKDREVVKKYKDFEMTEDVSTGEITIQRQKPSDFEYYDEMLNEDVYMSYKPGKGQADETMKGKTPLDEYTEDTSYIRTSGSQKGDIYDTVDGIPDDVLEEAGEKIIEKKIKSSPLDKAEGGIARMLGE